MCVGVKLKYGELDKKRKLLFIAQQSTSSCFTLPFCLTVGQWGVGVGVGWGGGIRKEKEREKTERQKQR